MPRTPLALALALVLAGCPSADSANSKDTQVVDSGDPGSDTAEWVSVPGDATAPWAEVHYAAVGPDGTEYRYDCAPTDTDRETLVLCGPMDDGSWSMQLLCSPTAASITEAVAVAIQAAGPLTTTDFCSDQAQGGAVIQKADGSFLLLDCHFAEAAPDYEFVLSRAEFPDAVTMIAEGHFAGTVTYNGADYATSGEFAARLAVSDACL